MHFMQTKIREFRTRAGLTQEDLAKIAGVRRETIVFLEQGKYNPSLKLAHGISRALRARIEDLFIFNDEVPESENREVLID